MQGDSRGSMQASVAEAFTPKSVPDILCLAQCESALDEHRAYSTPWSGVPCMTHNARAKQVRVLSRLGILVGLTFGRQMVRCCLRGCRAVAMEVSF